MDLDSGIASGDLLKVYNGILEAVREISEHLRYNTSNKITTNNDFAHMNTTPSSRLVIYNHDGLLKL